MSRTTRRMVSWHPDEWARIREHADKAEMPVARYIREAALAFGPTIDRLAHALSGESGLSVHYFVHVDRQGQKAAREAWAMFCDRGHSNAKAVAAARRFLRDQQPSISQIEPAVRAAAVVKRVAWWKGVQTQLDFLASAS